MGDDKEPILKRNRNEECADETKRRACYKFDELKRKEYLALIARGIGRHEAARTVGVTPQLVCDYAKRQPEWKERVSRAEMESTDKVEEALFKKCMEGNPSCMFFWLQNMRPEKWQDKRAPKIVVEKEISTSPEHLRAELERMLNINTGDS